ncbi:hypothetical protein ACVW0I_001965 [Bradyrhizobium sp. LM6.11]
MMMAPIGTSARFGRTWLRLAANSEPMAMPIAKTARHSVTTPSVPPTTSLTSAGSSESTMAPTSQNQETITVPSHSRWSACSVFNRPSVEVQGLALTDRSGADGVVAGMREATAQDSRASTTTADATQPICAEPATNWPPVTVPSRMAMKVAPSTSALPVASSPSASWSGSIEYFTGPNRAAMTPNSASAANSSGTECSKKPAAAKPAAKILGEFEPPRDDGFDVFVGELPAEPGQDEIGEDEDGACDRHQRISVAGRDTVKQDDDECVLEHVVIQRREELRPEQGRKAA